MADRSVSVSLTASTAGFTSAFRSAGKSAVSSLSAADRAVAAHGRSMSRLRNTVAGLGLGYAAFRIGKAAISTFADFEQKMSGVEAATQATTGEMTALREAALQAGADTSFSASDAADGITELGKAGLSTNQILHGGLNGALALAAAGELEVGEAAEITASSLNQFALQGSQATHVADLLAAGAGKAQGEVTDIGAALNQSGLVANSFGISIEDSVGALAAFASKGLIGSDAGTSFKTMLQGLIPRSAEAGAAMKKLNIEAFDQQGNFVGLTEYAGKLQKGLAGLSQEQRNTALKTIFGSDAVRAANILYDEGAKGIKGWTNAVDDQGFAAETAATKTDNLRGDMERLGGSLETAAIRGIDAFSPMFRSIASGAEDLVNSGVPKLEEFGKATSDFLNKFLGMGVDGAGSLQPLISRLQDLYQAALPIAQNVGPALGNAFKLVGGGIAALLSAVTPLVSAFGNLPDGMQQAIITLAALKVAASTVGVSLSGIGAGAGRAAASLGLVNTAAQKATVGITATELAAQRSATRMSTLGAGLKGASGLAGGLLAIDGLTRDATSSLGALETIGGGALLGFSVGGPIGAAVGAGVGGLLSLGKAILGVGDDAGSAAGSVSSFAGSLDEISGAATGATRELVALALQKAGLLDAGADAGLSGGSLVDAVMGSEADFEAVDNRIDTSIANLESQAETIRNQDWLTPSQQAAAVEQVKAIESQVDGLKKLGSALGENRTGLQSDIANQRQLTAAIRGTQVNVKDYNAALSALPREASTQIKALGADVTRRDVVDLGKQYKLTPKQVNTTMRVLGFAEVKRGLEDVKRGAKDVEGADPKVTVDVDEDSALGGLDNVKGKADDVGRMHPTPQVTVNPGNSLGTLGSIAGAIARLTSKTVTITTIYRQIGNAASALNPFSADGNIFPSVYARGGFEDHRAVIAHGQTPYRVWAEPETGGEAYIPLARTKRDRSMQIWRQTGRLLGAQFMEYARGGINSKGYDGPTIDQMLKAFGIGDKTDVRTGKSEVAELLQGLRQAFGPDSHIVKRVQGLADNLLKELKQRDHLLKAMRDQTDELKQTRQAQAQYTNQVASNFTNDMFAEGNTLQDALLQGRADKNDARQFDKQLRRARRFGLSGAAFKQLAASGNMDIAGELDSRKDVKALEQVLARQRAAARAVGSLAGGEVYGAQIRAQTHEVRRMRRDLHRMTQRVDNMSHNIEKVPRRVERGSEKGSGKGHRNRVRHGNGKRMRA